MTWNNLLAWSIQIGLLVAIAAGGAMLLRMRAPAARLFYWQMALAACLVMPLVRPWKQEVMSGSVEVSMGPVRVAPAPAASRGIPLRDAALWAIAAGIAARAGWLGLGFWRLRRYRRRSLPFGTRDRVPLLIAQEISGAVTFGALRPVVLLPARFPDLAPHMREAILRHELAHVRRRDWLFILAEEVVRTAFWFHPAVWWLLAQIQLSREQTVDHEVAGDAGSREEYVDALLTVAGMERLSPMAPAPLFLRRRHLKERVVSILRETSMSKTRLASSLAAGFGVLTAACWLLTAAFPLTAAPEVIADAPGVKVETGGATPMHRSGVIYPEDARKLKVGGTVTVQVKIGADGTVADAMALAGPEELRGAALRSVLDWHFGKDAAGTTRQVSITFEPSAAAPAPAQPKGPAKVIGAGKPLATLESITVVGLSESARAELMAKLQAHEGAPYDPVRLMPEIKEFDPHLGVRLTPAVGGGLALTVGPEETLRAPDLAPARIFRRGGEPVGGTVGGPVAGIVGVTIGGMPAVPPGIKVDKDIQQAKLVTKVNPGYPALAKQARLQGVVKLQVQIGKDGAVQNIQTISGHPLLVPAAIEAVRQWVYQPTLLNGDPVEVLTQVDVNFTLSE